VPRRREVVQPLLELVEYGFGDGQRKPRQFDRRPKSGRDLEGRGSGIVEFERLCISCAVCFPS